MEEDDFLPSTSQSINFDSGEGTSHSLLSQSSISRKIHPVGATLENLGNTCFMNVILQCITHMVPFVQKLLSAAHPIPCSHEEEGFCTFCALKEHVVKSINASGSVLVPTKFAKNLDKILPEYEENSQEDAHEFLRALLDRIDDCSLLRCCECGHCSETFEPLLDLSLDINDADNLTDALLSYTMVEKIEAKFTCEGCNTQVSMKKQLTLDQAPDVVAIQLKRFKNDGHCTHKIDKKVEYPSELDLKPYLSCPDERVQTKYDLYGIVDHTGSLASGHYDCTIRSSATAWYQLEDAVNQVKVSSALNQCAYLLFYIKQGLSPWFSSLLPAKDESQLDSATNTSPTSVIENIGRVHSTYHAEKDEECGPSNTTFVSDDTETYYNTAPRLCYATRGDKIVDKADADQSVTPPARKFDSVQHVIDSTFHDEKL
ncbi:Ubiquitin carboxyl-terminal hydrolase 20, partial [Ananas comosus]